MSSRSPGALAAATGGGASRFPGADVLTCVLHLLLLSLRCRVRFEFVPSEANIADWPTRADKVGLIPAWVVWISVSMLPAYLFSLDDSRVLQAWANVLALHPAQALEPE